METDLTTENKKDYKTELGPAEFKGDQLHSFHGYTENVTFKSIVAKSVKISTGQFFTKKISTKNARFTTFPNLRQNSVNSIEIKYFLPQMVLLAMVILALVRLALVLLAVQLFACFGQKLAPA